MARRDGMPRLELISRHLASGAGCNARPRLLATQEDFLSPPVCIGSTGTFRVPGTSPAQIEPHRVAKNVRNTRAKERQRREQAICQGAGSTRQGRAGDTARAGTIETEIRTIAMAIGKSSARARSVFPGGLSRPMEPNKVWPPYRDLEAIGPSPEATLEGQQ